MSKKEDETVSLPSEQGYKDYNYDQQGDPWARNNYQQDSNLGTCLHDSLDILLLYTICQSLFFPAWFEVVNISEFKTLALLGGRGTGALWTILA